MSQTQLRIAGDLSSWFFSFFFLQMKLTWHNSKLQKQLFIYFIYTTFSFINSWLYLKIWSFEFFFKYGMVSGEIKISWLDFYWRLSVLIIYNYYCKNFWQIVLIINDMISFLHKPWEQMNERLSIVKIHLESVVIEWVKHYNELCLRQW